VAWSPRWSRWSRGNQVWRFYRVARLLFETLWILVQQRNRVMRAHARGQYGVRPDTEALRSVMAEFRETAVALGGLMIKMGQFLSARADLLPQEALAELALLQDEVPPEPFEAIAQAIECELHAPISSIFARFDPVPAGSASLGQVHRARLRSGLDVAVKVQRPGVEHLVQADLAALQFVLEVVRVLLPAAERTLDTRRLFREFSRMVYEELDYQHEGHNAERFARLFAETDDIRVPSVIWEQSTRRVLVLSWVDGIKIGDTAALDRAGLNRRAIAQRLLEVYLQQVLHHGYYHADPHPGNIFVRPRPSGFQLAFVDFGMMGVITAAHKRALRSAFMAVVQQDAPLLVDALEALGFLGPGANRTSLEQALTHLLGRYVVLTMAEVREMDTVEMMQDVESLLYGHPFRLPYQFAFLGRAAGTLSGVVSALAPELNFVEAVLPYVRQYVARDALTGLLHIMGVESLGELGHLMTREGVAMARSISALPRLAERVLQRMERGELEVQLNSPPGGYRPRDRAVGRIAERTLNQPVPAWVPLGLVAAAAVALTVSRRTSHRG
jgi:predicted unusual protein kinase regulating ubiquinone biosynthesis (AarF/ABC1/UbiB family)